MMGRNILFFLSLSVILPSCSRSFTVDAEIGSEDYDGVTVYMIRKHPVEYSENTVLDSTVISGGRYGFTYRISEEPFIAIFELEPKGVSGHTEFYYDLPQASCVVEPGRVDLIYEADGVKVSGTPANTDYEKYILSPQRQARSKSIEYAGRTSMSDSIRFFYNETRPDIVAFVRKYADSRVGATVFFSRAEGFYGDSLYSSTVKCIAHEYVAMDKARTERMEEERKAAETARISSREGNPYVDFMSLARDGSERRFSQIAGSGNVTLLVFWASWCRPCRNEIPELKRLYETYHKAGLEMVSVSLDTRRGEWEKALDEEKMPWPQWSTLEGFGSASSKAYAVQAIPYVVLIDRNGIISLVNIHGNALEESIKDLLGSQMQFSE